MQVMASFASVLSFLRKPVRFGRKAKKNSLENDMWAIE
jgi:hypothetical protein